MRSPEPHPPFNLTQVPPSFVTFLPFLFNYTFILVGRIHLVLHESRKRGHTKKRFVPSDLRYRGGWRPKIAANQRISDKWGLFSVYLLSAVFFPLLHVSNINKQTKPITNYQQMRSLFCLPALKYLTYIFCLFALCHFLFSSSCLKYQITNTKQITHGRQTEPFLSTCSQIFYLSFLFTCSLLLSRLYYCGYNR